MQVVFWLIWWGYIYGTNLQVICRQAGITEINGAITMIYASILNTNDKVKFTVLNYHHEELGGRERSKDWQFANLSVRQDAKIYSFFFKKGIV